MARHLSWHLCMLCFLRTSLTAAARPPPLSVFRSLLLPELAFLNLLPGSRFFSRAKPLATPRIIPAHIIGHVDMSAPAPSASAALPVISLTPTESALFSQLKDFVLHRNSSGKKHPRTLHARRDGSLTLCPQAASHASCACAAAGSETNCCKKTMTTLTFA